MTEKPVNTLSTLSTLYYPHGSTLNRGYHTIHKPANKVSKFTNSVRCICIWVFGIGADDVDINVDVDVDDVDVRQDLRELALDSSPRLHNRPPSILS